MFKSTVLFYFNTYFVNISHRISKKKDWTSYMVSKFYLAIIHLITQRQSPTEKHDWYYKLTKTALFVKHNEILEEIMLISLIFINTFEVIVNTKFKCIIFFNTKIYSFI